MTTDPTSSLDATLDEATVAGMVRMLEPDWQVEAVERFDHGTDFVAGVEVAAPEGRRAAVLKATTADLVTPAVARAEPRLLALVDRETEVPVPTVYGFRDRHERYPAPFFLMDRVEGENLEGRADRLSPEARETVLREAGRNLAALHDLGPLPGVGKVGVREGSLTVLDTDEHPRYDDFRERLLANCEETLDSLEDGGFFPALAEEPGRFADLVTPLRTHVRETVPALPAPDPPTYCHWDYRYGNLLVDPETGATRAVLDWANLSAADPAYNLASAESLLLAPEREPAARTAALRRTFRSAYAGARDGWAFDDAVKERMRTYRLACRLGAMACLPLWERDAEARDEREADHRAFVERYC